MPSPVASRAALRASLIKHFSLSELDDLCFTAGADREMITSGEHDNKATRVRRIIIYFQERGELVRLLNACEKERPGQATWLEFVNAARESLPDPIAVRRKRVVLGAIGLAVLALTAAFAFELPPFPRRVKADQQVGTIPVSGAHRLARVGDTLLISTLTDGPCPSNDTGLFALADAESFWQPIRVPLHYSASNCATITAFAHTPDVNRVYAATSQAGLLRSDDPRNELSWTRVGTGTVLPSDLDLVTVSPRDAHLVFASGRRDGLFRSQDGGDTWERLDNAIAGTTQCSEPGTAALSNTMHIAAMAVTFDVIFVATGRDDDYPTAEDGLYVSRDGLCWQLLESANQRYVYRALATIPGDADHILILTYDKESASLFAQASQLWRFRVAPFTNRGRVAELSKFKPTTRALYVTPDSPFTWFAATETGEVYSGTVFGTQVHALPMVFECALPLPWAACTEAVALAEDVLPGPPLLLAAGQVFRLK